jgi:hypothetical protein
MNPSSVGDLRSILAKIAQAPDTAESTQKSGYRGKAGSEAAKPPPGAISPLKDALAALHSVSATPNRVLPPRPVKPADVPKLHAMTASDQAELAAMTAEAEAMMATLSPTPQFTPTSVKDTDAQSGGSRAASSATSAVHSLDPKQVVKLLKSTGHQKTPF